LFSKETIAGLKKSIRQGKVWSGPIDLQILPTTRCNENCVFCPTQAVSKSAKEKFAKRWLVEETDLNFGVFDRMIDDLYRLGGIKRIHITGGEPLLHKRMMAIIFLLRRSFPAAEIALVTNGILLPNFAQALALSGLDRISISVNAGTEKNFAEQTRVAGSNLEKIGQGIKLIRRHRDEKSLGKPYLSMTAVLNRHNFQEVEELTKFGIDSGAEAVSWLALMDFPFPGERPKEFALSEKEFQEFQKEMTRLQPRAKQKGIYLGFTGAPEHLGKLRAGDLYQKVRCYSGYSFAMVWPDGSVRPCCNCETSLGNLREQSFYRIWNSSRAQEIRERMLKITEQGPPDLCDCPECGYLFENQEFQRLMKKNE